MFISDKVSSMTKLQPNTVIRAALDLLNEVGVDGLTTRKLAERLGFSSRRFTGTSGTSGRCLDALAEAMLAENHTHSVPRADDDWRSFLIGNAPQLQAGAARLPRWRAHPCRHATGRTADGNGRRAAFASSARRVFRPGTPSMR